MTIRHYLTISASAFTTGAGGYLATHLNGQIPTNAQGIAAVALGAAIGGLIAVSHLLQPAPDAVDRLRGGAAGSSSSGAAS